MGTRGLLLVLFDYLGTTLGKRQQQHQQQQQRQQQWRTDGRKEEGGRGLRPASSFPDVGLLVSGFIYTAELLVVQQHKKIKQVFFVPRSTTKRRAKKRMFINVQRKKKDPAQITSSSTWTYWLSFVFTGSIHYWYKVELWIDRIHLNLVIKINSRKSHECSSTFKEIPSSMGRNFFFGYEMQWTQSTWTYLLVRKLSFVLTGSIRYWCKVQLCIDLIHLNLVIKINTRQSCLMSKRIETFEKSSISNEKPSPLPINRNGSADRPPRLTIARLARIELDFGGPWNIDAIRPARPSSGVRLNEWSDGP